MHMPEIRPADLFEFARSMRCVMLIDIVKKRFVCNCREPRLWCLTAHNRQIEAQISFSYQCSSAGFLAEVLHPRWALIMRAIKRLKGIWWMPWH